MAASPADVYTSVSAPARLRAAQLNTRTPAPAERPGPLRPKEVNKLNSYELMVILRPDADEEARTGLIGRAKEIITTEQGIVGKVDEWGKRRFAYEIDHMTEGYYYVMYFQAETKTLDEVTRVLNIADICVRLLPIRLDEPVTKE
jgi:small subunit ribosomal protein S6